MHASTPLRLGRMPARRIFSWTLTILFWALLGGLALQVLQRVHDRYTPRRDERFSEFLSREFYVGNKGERTVPGTGRPGFHLERLALSVFLYPNAHLDLTFRPAPDRCNLIRFSAAARMPSALVSRRDGVAVDVAPLNPPGIAPGRWHRVELVREPARIEVRIDGDRVGTSTDPSWPNGSVGLASGFVMVKVDRLEVSGTQRPPDAAERAFVYRWQNVFRRPWAAACLLVGFVVLGCATRRALEHPVLRGRRRRSDLDRGYIIPLLMLAAGFRVTILPRLLFLALAALMLLVSRLGYALSAGAGFFPDRFRRLRWKPVAVTAGFAVLLCGFLAWMGRENDSPPAFGEGAVFRAPGPRRVEPNFPFRPTEESVRDFRWTFQARLAPETVAEAVLGKDDESDADGRSKDNGRNWVALVLSNAAGLSPGFARVRHLDEYRKKAPEAAVDSLPAGAWIPVRLEAMAGTFRADVGAGTVRDLFRDGDRRAGFCKLVLLQGELEIRDSVFTRLEPRQDAGDGDGPGAGKPVSRPDVPHEGMRVPDPVAGLGWYLRTPYRYENTFLLDQSFRGRRFLREPQAGATRVVCIGGSSTYGLFLPEGAGADYPHELERQLNREAGAGRFEVINAGVIGTYSLRSVEYLSTVLLPFRPDVVLVNLVWNDNIIPAVMEEGYPQFKETLHGWRRSILVAPFLYAKAWIDFLAGGAEFIHRMKTGAGGGGAINPENLPLYEENLESLVDTARSAGVKIAFILEPSSDLQGVERGREVLGEMYDVMERVARRRGVPLIDPRGPLRAHSYDDLFYDVMHLTPAGHRRVAGEIRRSLRDAWPELFPGGEPLRRETSGSPSSRADPGSR